MQRSYLIVLSILATGAAISYLTKKLTFAASITGASLGLILFMGAGWTGIVMMAVFFILGTAATSWKRNLKQQISIGELGSGRNSGQVFANGGAAGLIALASWIFPLYHQVCLLMIAAAFSSATADTLSSELGTVYGKSFFNIISFKKDKKGLDGVVSLEGFLFGLAGSIIIALIYSFFEGWDFSFLLIIIAGTAGNLFDSILGAALERKGLIKNDSVNFLNTVFAALIALLLSFCSYN